MEETVLSLETSALERWCSGDPWGFLEISDTGITAVDPYVAKPIMGLDHYKAHLTQFEGVVQGQRVEITHPLVQRHGDAAVLTYQFQVTPADDGASQARWNVTAVYFRLGEMWRLVHSHRAYLKHKLPDSVEVPLPLEIPQKEYDGVLGEIMALESAAMLRWRKGDPWGFVELYDPTVTYFDTGTMLRLDGVETLRAEYATRAGKIFYDVMDFIDPRVQVCGDVAVLFYRFFSTALKPDGSIANRIPWNSTEVYVRTGGQWRIVHNHWSFIKGQPIES